ncbi:MAG: NAD(P)(+) transhydrogenase (Re/Si-specific) subunit alpha, partial [Methylococcales bacterium]
MKIGIPKEIHQGEKRVATTPDAAAQIMKLGFTVCIESGAGLNADISDAAYQAVGVEVVADAATLWREADIVMKVRAPEPQEVDLMSNGGRLISFIWPAQQPELMDKLAAKSATVLAMDSVPRMSRAQKCDALSSMANIAGYRA